VFTLVKKTRMLKTIKLSRIITRVLLSLNAYKYESQKYKIEPFPIKLY